MKIDTRLWRNTSPHPDVVESANRYAAKKKILAMA